MMGDVRTVEKIREGMRGLAMRVERLESQLRALGETVPMTPAREAMYECAIPYDVAAELAALTEYVLDDYLGPARTALDRAAGVEQAELDRRFAAYRALGAPIPHRADRRWAGSRWRP